MPAPVTRDRDGAGVRVCLHRLRGLDEPLDDSNRDVVRDVPADEGEIETRALRYAADDVARVPTRAKVFLIWEAEPLLWIVVGDPARPDRVLVRVAGLGAEVELFAD